MAEGEGSCNKESVKGGSNRMGSLGGILEGIVSGGKEAFLLLITVSIKARSTSDTSPNKEITLFN